MNPIEFNEQTIVIAKDQPEYKPLPAHVSGDEYGTIVFCWKINWRDKLKLIFTGVIWQQALTFNAPLQPQLLSIEKPDMVNGITEE